jgi:hypothetical protein
MVNRWLLFAEASEMAVFSRFIDELTPLLKFQMIQILRKFSQPLNRR